MLAALKVERLKAKLGELHNSDVNQLKCATMSEPPCLFYVCDCLIQASIT
jgi:hypothetical protein